MTPTLTRRRLGSLLAAGSLGAGPIAPQADAATADLLLFDSQLVPVHRCQRKTALVTALYQPLGRQAAQRLAQRAGAHTVALAHRLDPQPGARFEQAVGDVGA